MVTDRQTNDSVNSIMPIADQGIWGAPSGVWGGAPAEIEFGGNKFEDLP